jgi:hypothetical protein
MLKRKRAFIVRIWRAAEAAAACRTSNDRAESAASAGAKGIAMGPSVRAPAAEKHFRPRRVMQV